MPNVLFLRCFLNFLLQSAKRWTRPRTFGCYELLLRIVTENVTQIYIKSTNLCELFFSTRVKLLVYAPRDVLKRNT